MNIKESVPTKTDGFPWYTHVQRNDETRTTSAKDQAAKTRRSKQIGDSFASLFENVQYHCDCCPVCVSRNVEAMKKEKRT